MDQRNRGDKRWKPIPPHKLQACLERILPHVNDDLSIPLDDPLSSGMLSFPRVYVDEGTPPIRIVFTLPDLITRLTLSERHVSDPRPVLRDVDFRDHLTIQDVVRVEYLVPRNSPSQLWREVATGKRKRISLAEYLAIFPTTEKELVCLKAKPIHPLPSFPLRTDAHGNQFLLSRELLEWHKKLAALRRASSNGHDNGNGGAR
jgi:hypothetical protein